MTVPSAIAVSTCDALACGFRCLQSCPLGVLMAMARGLPTKPRGYAIAPSFHGHCNACGICIEVCPQGAISLRPP